MEVKSIVMILETVLGCAGVGGQGGCRLWFLHRRNEFPHLGRDY